MKTTINNTEFLFDEFEDGWGWSTKDTESNRCFETAAEAQQDAMRFVRDQEVDGREHAEQEVDEQRFGSYEQQVEAEWKAGRL